MRTHCLEVDVAIDVWNIPVLGNDAVTIDGKRRRVSTTVLAMDDEVKIQPVYNVYSEEWIYEAEGVYFSVEASWTNSYIDQYKRDETCKYIVTEEDLDNNRFPGYDGKVGDVLYGYNFLTSAVLTFPRG